MQNAIYMKPLIFVGPSLSPRAQELIAQHQLAVQPPVCRGDIDRLMGSGFLGTLIMVDGRFKEVLAVGHAEIRHALEKGCSVYGLSSMGAIRAYEMETLGMQGFGKVFQYFKKEEDFQDDEVALLHGQSPFFYTFSEPLVHFRECVKEYVGNGQLSKEAGQVIIATLKEQYFGKRTMDQFCTLMAQHGGITTEEIPRDFDRFRIKQQDLIHFLEVAPWTVKT